MEKLWYFCVGGKKCVLCLKKWGKICPEIQNVVLMFVALVITSLALQTFLTGYRASLLLSLVKAVNFVRPLTWLRQLAPLLSY